jgi:hypothetical protein
VPELPDVDARSLPPAPLPSGDREVPTWRFLLGAIGEAGRPRVLVLASVGLLLTIAGWGAIDAAIGAGGPGLRDRSLSPRPGIERFDGTGPAWLALYRAAATIADPVRVVAGPISGVLAIGAPGRDVLRDLLAAAWGLGVWGVVGGSIGRMGLDRLDPRAEGSGALTTIGSLLRRLGALLGAPLGLAVLVGVLAVPSAAVGLLDRLGVPGIDPMVGPLLLLAVPMAFAVVLLLAGWPLMVMTVAIEGEDAFDAIGRAFGYLSRRPSLFVGSVVLAWAGGAVGLLLASQFARLVLHLAGWGLAIGGGSDDGARWSGDGPMWEAWGPAVGFLLHAWAFGFGWSAFSRIYAVLRSEVDGTPRHDLARPGDDAEPFAPDPPGGDAA